MGRMTVPYSVALSSLNAENDSNRLPRLYMALYPAGAHAIVYLATDISEDVQKDYAIKVMNLEPPPDEDDNRLGVQKNRSREVRLSQVLREVDIHGLMQHTNIVQLESYFQDRSRFYMVLEHCEHSTLAQLLRYRGRLEESETRILLRQLLEGLKHIHDRGIIHRDLKPANIYLTQDMILKIGDFGLADRIRTKSRGICGTPNYISPEVLMEQGYTTAVDVWAVGCITYNMVCGKPPFEAGTPSATYDLIRAHRYSAIPSTKARAALRHLISWMLAFQPEDRPTIPFILNHVWMRRNRETKESNWLKSHKKRKGSVEKAPIAEITTTETTLKACEEASEESQREDLKEGKKEFSFWKSILEKAKIHTKVLSYEDVNNKPMFQHLRSRVYFAISARKREPVKKAVEQVLKGIPIPRCEDMTDNSATEAPIFISKWIDYSNKYGFGYQMTDGATGVFFNDSSQIILDGSKTNFTWCRRGKKVTYPVHSVPNQLQGKVLLLNYFADYMDNHLSSGATQDYRQESYKPVSLLRQWMKNEKIILFETTSGLLQTNFFSDHYKMMFYQEEDMDEKSIILIVIDDEKKMRRYNLSKMGSRGCPDDVLSHLMYIIASQDRELQQKCRKIEGVPLLYLHSRTPVLEPPSFVTQGVANEKTLSSFSVNAFEKDKLLLLNKEEGEVKGEVKERKRKRKGGPNPLSCKKKKKKQEESVKSKEKNPNKRKRKRNRSVLLKKIKSEVMASLS